MAYANQTGGKKTSTYLPMIGSSSASTKKKADGLSGFKAIGSALSKSPSEIISGIKNYKAPSIPVSKTAGYSQARPVSIPSPTKTAGYSVTPRHNGSGTQAVKNTPATVNASVRSSSSGGSGGGGGGSVASTTSANAAKQASMLKAMEDFLKNSSNAQYKQQEAGFARTRDQQINDIGKAFDEAVKTGKVSIEEANIAFDDAVKQLDANLYRDTQLTNITGFDRGIQNSQQLIGLQQGDTNRKNVQQTEFSVERTRRVNALNDRIASLTKQKDLDIGQAKTDYNYNITGARASADMALNEGLFQLKQTEYNNMQAMAQALASRSFSSGGGGGGGSTRTTSKPTYTVSPSKTLDNSLKEFVASKQQTSLDDYYTRRQNLTKRSVMDTRTPLGAPVSVANNPTLSAYEKMKMFGG